MQALYMTRTVKCYAVQDGELGTLTSLGVQASLFLAAASAAIGYAVSIWVSRSFVTTLTDQGKGALAVAPFLLIVGLASLVVAVVYTIQGTVLWRKIVRESEPVVTQTTIVSAVGAAIGSAVVTGVTAAPPAGPT